MSDFKVGDIVRHKASGNYGPNMTINSVNPDKAFCTYYHEQEKVFKQHVFHPAELEAASANRDISVH